MKKSNARITAVILLGAIAALIVTGQQVVLYTGQPGSVPVAIGSAAAATAVKLAPGSEATCNSSTDGTITYTEGGSGVSSQLRACVKLSDDSYAWVPLI